LTEAPLEDHESEITEGRFGLGGNRRLGGEAVGEESELVGFPCGGEVGQPENVVAGHYQVGGRRFRRIEIGPVRSVQDDRSQLRAGGEHCFGPPAWAGSQDRVQGVTDRLRLAPVFAGQVFELGHDPADLGAADERIGGPSHGA
jgi:hypothetical protein